ncbi:MAG: transporter substrate-binding domain-containing protein [Gemmatimonadaceae bacterium]
MIARLGSETSLRREAAKRSPQRAGYKVIKTRNGGEALEVAASEPRIDLLITGSTSSEKRFTTARVLITIRSALSGRNPSDVRAGQLHSFDEMIRNLSMCSSQIVFPALVILLMAGCDLPRDADGATDRIQNGVVRVGVADNPPWVAVGDTEVSGIEPTMIAELAGQLGARIKTVHGSETRLLESLHRRELDIVIGGFLDDSPWKKDVALTTPYHEDRQGRKHVLALPPGENRWLMRVERYLHENEKKLEALPE